MSVFRRVWSLQVVVALISVSTAVSACRTTRTSAAVRKVFKDLAVSTVRITSITLSTIMHHRYTANCSQLFAETLHYTGLSP